MPDPYLPPALEALALLAPTGPLEAVTVRLDAGTLAELEALRERLHGPSRGALARFLLVQGLRVVAAELAEAAPVPGPWIQAAAEPIHRLPGGAADA